MAIALSAGVRMHFVAREREQRGMEGCRRTGWRGAVVDLESGNACARTRGCQQLRCIAGFCENALGGKWTRGATPPRNV
eukprot:scaffold21541_cov30-Tisochrysis_lutea.AAC.2